MRVSTAGSNASALHRHRTAVHSAEQPLAFQRYEVFADRLTGDTERFGDLDRVDATATQQLIKDVILALIGVEGAGVIVVGGHSR